MKKRVCALFCIMTMVVLSMAGCGKKDLLTTAMTTANEAKSVEGNATMDLSMKVSMLGQSQDINMTMKMDMFMFSDPYKMKTNANISLAGQSTDMEMYLAKENDKYMTYTKAAGVWSKTPVCSADDLEQAKKKNSIFNVASYTKLKESLKPAKDEEENGKTYKTYTGVMTKEMMKEALESSMGSSLGSITGDVKDDTMNEVINNMKDMSYTIWLDPEDEVLYRVKFSMGDLMKSVLDAAMKAADSTEGSQIKMDVSKCDMDIIYKNYNNVSDFTVPAEALAAKEAEVEAK